MSNNSVFSRPHFSVALYGPDRPRTRDLPLLHRGVAGKVCLVKFASSQKDPGFSQIALPVFGQQASDDFDIYADGVILTKPRTSVVVQTADCFTVVMYEAYSKKLFVLHAGRPSTTPQNKPGRKIQNIVTQAYELLTYLVTNPKVEVYITGGICGNCFTHDHPSAEKFITPFDQFGDLAFTDRATGALDLQSVITTQLHELGVSPSAINHDGLCTKETAWLTSYRRDKVPRNAVVVVLH